MCFLHVCLQGEEIVAVNVAEPAFDLGVVMLDMKMSHSEIAIRTPTDDAEPQALHPLLCHPYYKVDVLLYSCPGEEVLQKAVKT